MPEDKKKHTNIIPPKMLLIKQEEQKDGIDPCAGSACAFCNECDGQNRGEE